MVNPEKNIAAAAGPETRVVGIAELAVSDNPSEILITYSLGACVGLTLYDPKTEVGGLIHCMLPQSSTDPEKARTRPAMFVDSGVKHLIEKLCDIGGIKDFFEARVAGAASLMDNQRLFQIGKRNLVVLRRTLDREGIPIAGEEVGGTKARTLVLDLSSGETRLKSRDKEEIL